MSTVKTDYLAVSWSTSRGRDTYGYNICRLDVRSTDRRYKCMGGGYDMLGTCVGEWLQANYQGRLNAIAHRAHSSNTGGVALGQRETLYGMRRAGDGSASLDGACGVESMVRIAEAIGLSLSRTHDRKGNTTGYMVTDYGSAEALKAAES